MESDISSGAQEDCKKIIANLQSNIVKLVQKYKVGYDKWVNFPNKPADERYACKIFVGLIRDTDDEYAPKPTLSTAELSEYLILSEADVDVTDIDAVFMDED